jgi:hypothetical protein
MQLVFGAKASPLVILRVYPTLTISLVGVSEFAVQVMKTMTEHPELLGESLTFFPCLYHTYHFAFRSVPVHARVHQLLGLLRYLTLSTLLIPSDLLIFP